MLASLESIYLKIKQGWKFSPCPRRVRLRGLKVTYCVPSGVITFLQNSSFHSPIFDMYYIVHHYTLKCQTVFVKRSVPKAERTYVKSNKQIEVHKGNLKVNWLITYLREEFLGDFLLRRELSYNSFDYKRRKRIERRWTRQPPHTYRVTNSIHRDSSVTTKLKGISDRVEN